MVLEGGEGAFGASVGGFEACAEAAGERVASDGFEDFAGSAGAGMVFADISRTFPNILDVSGVTGGFEAGFEGAGVGALDSVFVAAGVVGAGGFGAGFDAVVIIGAFFAGLGAALVDFALVVDFFVSGKSISMGSEMTFLGLPLFLTISVDILRAELALLEVFFGGLKS